MDIDLDFADRDQALRIFDHIPASIKDDKESFKRHNTGIYIQAIPHNPITGLSTIDYKEAEKRGYFKIDFLNVSVYNGVRNKQHLLELMNTEPLWDLLKDDEFTNMIFHINGHGTILRQMTPTSIEQLAAILAIIRPAKRYLIGKDWNTVMNEVWNKPTDTEFYFKKSHAIAYAVAIVVQMNLICEQLESQAAN